MSIHISYNQERSRVMFGKI